MNNENDGKPSVFIRLLEKFGAGFEKEFHRFASLHTWLNKLTGVAVFLLPYVLWSSYIDIYSWFVCVLAFAASLEELAIHLFRTEYLADRKGLYKK